MKLLVCLSCSDVFALRYEERACFCGKSRGKYVDKKNAHIEGNSMPIGFDNRDFRSAIKAQALIDKDENPLITSGMRFEAFTIPDTADSIKRISDEKEL